MDAARDRWAAAGIDSYRYTINHGPCLCPGPLHGEIVVVAGRVESVTLLDQRGDTEWSRQQLDETVDDLFRRIEAGLGFDRFGAPGEIRVTYDSRTGVPLHVSIDPDVSTIDEEFSWVLTFEAGAVPVDAVPGPEAAAPLSEVGP
ncbi:MAG: DUF6174 domain-containing protein [Acidimicrobiia bacterium]|nr:DUF6174 domain-containing protein [Acidimicrobiia bacterium]